MPNDAVAEIKSRLDIVDVVGGYVRLQRSGTSHKALCPFHSERTPSFNVNQTRQAWYCFGCSEGGDVFTFVEKMERVDFRQALELLAERAGVELSDRPGGERQRSGPRRARILDLHRIAQQFYEYVLWSTPAGEPGRALLRERGVTEELAHRFGVGFAPAGGQRGDALTEYLVQRGHGPAAEIAAAGLAHPPDRGPARDRFRHRLVFPIRDERGRTLGFGARALGDAVPKYLNTPATEAYDKSSALFGIDLARPAIGAAGMALVVEGYFDVVAAHAAGLAHTVASSGTALTAQQVRALGRLTKVVVLCFDADEAGRAAASRAVELLAAEGLEGRIVDLPGDAKDPDEVVRRDPEAFALAVSQAGREWQVLLDRALSGAEGGSVEERRTGAGRAVALLARIPEATTRELFVQQAARRLGLEPRAVADDVTRALAGHRGSAPVRVVAAAPQPRPSADAAVDVEAGRARPLRAWEQHIGSVVVQRPDLAATLLDAHGLRLDDLVSAGVRRLVETARTLPEGAGFPLHQLAPADQALAARLLLHGVPELGDDCDPERLGRALADCVWRVRGAALEAERERIRRERQIARDGGRTDEAEDLAVRLTRLSEELERHRRRTAPAA